MSDIKYSVASSGAEYTVPAQQVYAMHAAPQQQQQVQLQGAPSPVYAYPAGAQPGTYVIPPQNPTIVYYPGASAVPPQYSSSGAPMGVPAGVATVGGAAGERRGPPTGEWRDGLFDCCNNIWPSCLCNFILHGAWLMGQIAQRTGCASFNSLTIPACVIIFITYIISQFKGLGFVYIISIAVTWFIGIRLRLHVVEHYAIHTHGSCVECLIAAFCCPCSLSQMARHVYGYNKVLAGDADENVKDYYTV